MHSLNNYVRYLKINEYLELNQLGNKLFEILKDFKKFER